MNKRDLKIAVKNAVKYAVPEKEFKRIMRAERNAANEKVRIRDAAEKLARKLIADADARRSRRERAASMSALQQVHGYLVVAAMFEISVSRVRSIVGQYRNHPEEI